MLKSKNMKCAPELLSPAGNDESLNSALNFGADAVYLGGTEFGMRASPQNFNLENLETAVKAAHDKGAKVYFTCNTIPRNSDIDRLPDFLKEVAGCGIDAFIITDLGVFSLAKKNAPGIDIHISTQFGVMNYASAMALYEMGAKRIVMARELSLEEIVEIREKIPAEMEMECFIHGSMCVSFSGRCLLSNYLNSRDSNRGDCAQPCRWKYSLMEETRPGKYLPVFENDEGTYIMNAKDLCMIEYIPELVRAGISSFKIEGRAKSAYYTAVVTNAYRCAIDGWINSQSDKYRPAKWILDELGKISYRDYCTGFYFGKQNENTCINYEGGYRRDWDIAAIVISYESGMLTLEQRNRFFEGDELEVVEPGKEPVKIKVRELQTLDGDLLESAPHPKMVVKIYCPMLVSKEAVIRKRNISNTV